MRYARVYYVDTYTIKLEASTTNHASFPSFDNSQMCFSHVLIYHLARQMINIVPFISINIAFEEVISTLLILVQMFSSKDRVMYKTCDK